MKKARKLITFILTVVMVLSMSMNVWAVDITIDNDSSDSVYEAYRLLDATDGGDGKFAYTVNTDYEEVLTNVITTKGGSVTNQEDIIDYIRSLSDEKAIQEFANAVYKAIKEANPAMGADKTSENNKLSGVDQGYYLIAQTQKGDNDKASSLVMLDTAGKDDINIEPKEEVPTLEKEITAPDGSISTDGKKNNVSIGDYVEFTLTATIPQEAEYYDYYFCIFSDKLSDGLTFIEDEAEKELTVKADDTVLEEEKYALYLSPDTNAGDNTFKLALTDAKALAGKTITVTYWAKLNEDAELGTAGNTNTADLVYSNDPNTQYGDYKNTDDNGDEITPGLPDPTPEDENGDPLPDIPTGNTPDQDTTTYTTGIKLYKVDENEEALGGATFQIKDAEDNIIATKAVQKDGEDYVLTFEGLGAGTYTITETVVPEGYNKAADITVTITWNGEGNGDMWTATATPSDGEGNLNFDDAEGVFDLTIKNQSGSELPSTGGIGTTIFYIVGGALVLFAVVLLVTKKRMKDNQ